jgi:hypothetical protein
MTQSTEQSKLTALQKEHSLPEGARIIIDRPGMTVLEWDNRISIIAGKCHIWTDVYYLEEGDPNAKNLHDQPHLNLVLDSPNPETDDPPAYIRLWPDGRAVAETEFPTRSGGVVLDLTADNMNRKQITHEDVYGF